MSDDTSSDDRDEQPTVGPEKPEERAARDREKPPGEGTWLSGDDDDDPLREEAAERASRAVEPGRPRE